MALAHKLALQLRAAEDRIAQLEVEVALFRERATRAEGCFKRSTAKSNKGSPPRDSLQYRTRVGLIELQCGTKSASRCLRLP
jgi:hypothetical protein